jgi:hypothetical protein
LGERREMGGTETERRGGESAEGRGEPWERWEGVRESVSVCVYLQSNSERREEKDGSGGREEMENRVGERREENEIRGREGAQLECAQEDKREMLGGAGLSCEGCSLFSLFPRNSLSRPHRFLPRFFAAHSPTQLRSNLDDRTHSNRSATTV